MRCLCRSLTRYALSSVFYHNDEAINTTSSYLGDAVLRRSQIRRIVNDQFEEEYEIDGENISINMENVLKITSHPLMFAFTAGAGTVRHGSAQ